MANQLFEFSQSKEDREKLMAFMNVLCAHVALPHVQVIGGILIST